MIIYEEWFTDVPYLDIIHIPTHTHAGHLPETGREIGRNQLSRGYSHATISSLTSHNFTWTLGKHICMSGVFFMLPGQRFKPLSWPCEIQLPYSPGQEADCLIF